MRTASQCAVRSIDTDASAGNPCAWCQHSEYVHAYAGLCLFTQCTCPFFDPGPSRTAEASSGDAQ